MGSQRVHDAKNLVFIGATIGVVGSRLKIFLYAMIVIGVILTIVSLVLAI